MALGRNEFESAELTVIESGRAYVTVIEKSNNVLEMLKLGMEIISAVAGFIENMMSLGASHEQIERLDDLFESAMDEGQIVSNWRDQAPMPKDFTPN